MLNFIDAEVKDTDLLRDTLITSKGYWGYSQEQLEEWRSNLRFEEKYISRNTVKLILKDKDVIGFFAIVKGDSDELDHFWLLPKAIGKGYGNLVFEQILSECKTLDITEFYITSDPDAEGFYLKKGAFKVGEIYSEPQKRMLPRLKFTLAIVA
ncbi:acetyltransferase, GNAT family [Cellvibrio sp. BR]|uniref:GNAT family N-acetyltransferase n=1 Tax=unclassified Cellvibrio TaxID=2624793 RepID=UPI00026009C1|nr:MULTISPECIES: GNAT family N-acetyltransferase [unclassified Cellvibrio]EIK42907.1 acetyltransferase, GNAT family [Cellvibrio sp. BR]QEY14080.1 GNAT family N-acetyltransferase [Cellvibrio sp. KY-YJ-3]